MHDKSLKHIVQKPIFCRNRGKVLKIRESFQVFSSFIENQINPSRFNKLGYVQVIYLIDINVHSPYIMRKKIYERNTKE